jgi:hypothetical protein
MTEDPVKIIWWDEQHCAAWAIPCTREKKKAGSGLFAPTELNTSG